MKNETISKLNGKQNVEIAELKVEVKNLSDKLEKFMTNEFVHLRQKVDEQDKWRIATLTTSVFTLIGIIVTLIIK